MLSLKRCILTIGLGSLALVPGDPTAPVHAASYVVTTLADSGPGSLRQAILDANAAAGADTITFGVSGTITLASALPDITDPAGVTIDGSGQTVAVSGNDLVRPFLVAAGATADLQSLTVTTGSAFGGGGGISNSGTLTVSNSTISGNSAGVGGGINNAGTLTVSNSTISGNSSTFAGVGGVGGGLNNSGTLTVTNSSIRGNTSTVAGPFGGGGGISSSGTLTVSNSTISGNSGGVGGGILIGPGGMVAVSNSTISGNTGLFGGGGLNNSGTLTVTNSTISGNSSTDRGPFGGGGGIFNGGTLKVTNSIVANNTAHFIPGPDCHGTLTALGPNLIGDPADCTIAGPPPLTGDPKLGPLADNGGATQTHALLPGSPAIDAGDDPACAAAPVSGKDQRGVSRPQGAHCDLGSFELEASARVVGGRKLRITTGSIDLSWDGGTAQTGYTLLQYNANTGTSSLVTLPANATSHSHAAAVPGAMHCYALAATGPGDVVLGLSDLECAMSGIKTGTLAPVGFSLTLNQTATATLTWTAPAGGADAYLLQRLPLDGSAPTQVTLLGSATITTQAVSAAGGCYQLVAYKAGAWGASDALCGIPGFSTLGNQASRKVRTVGEAMADLQQRLAAVGVSVTEEH